jgi:imidazolonepropionase-like amidohydrolase
MSRLSRRGWIAGSSALAGALLVDRRASAQTPAGRFAIRGATLWNPEGPPLEPANIEMDRGVFTRVEAGGGGGAGSPTFDAKGMVATAGFVDLLTSVGLVEIDLERSARDDTHEVKDPIRAAFSAADGYNAASSVIPVTRAAGITSVGVVPHGGLVSGQSAWADLDGETPDDAIALRQLALHVFIDDAWAEGAEASIGTSLLRLRELIEDARAFKQNAGAFERRQLRRLSASRLDLKAVGLALDRKLSVVFHVDRASDILAVLRLVKENKLRAIIASGAEAWKVGKQIAAEKLPVVVYPLDNLPRSFAALGARDENATLLHMAGVSVVLSTGETHNARKLRQVAGNAVRAGLPREAALDAVTRAAARAVGLDARYGTVQAGKVANLVLWSGDPFELSTRAVAVVIRGRMVPLRTRQTALFERYKVLPGRR